MKFVVKSLMWLAGLIAVAAIGFAVVLVQSAIRPARTIGVQVVSAGDDRNQPITTVVYYPAEGEAKLTWLGATPAFLAREAPVTAGLHPLILISHGTAGSPTSHLDTAVALAERGFIVAAIVHNGDNYRDQSSVGQAGWISGRAHEVVRVTDYMLEAWSQRASIDADRIGLFGFSAGATTALVNVGAAPDFGRVAEACESRPELVCQLLSPGTVLNNPLASAHDSRIKTVLLAAPGFGMAFSPDSLQNVTIPVDIWVGVTDSNTPPATNAIAIARLLPSHPSVHVVEGAGHASFLAPCGVTRVLMPPMVCADTADFDRAAFHRTFNAEVVSFFVRSLNYSG
ncbi:MAG: alpha/beta hydrolase family protein [Hyphomonadaceae bacterium]